MERGYTYRQWVGSGGLSDHLMIYLDIRGEISKPRAPFKFNSTWLKDNSYICLVTDFWKAHPLANERNITNGFIDNLKELKKLSNIWAHNKRVQEEQNIRDNELEIVDMEDECEGLFLTNDHRDKLTTLITKRGNILKERKETWRLRSRAIWLKEGDDNSKFFHKFVNGRKEINTI